MAKRDPRMIPLGYGKFVRADRIYALVPLEGSERQDGRRTYVHVDGLTEPIVASRSERAIMADVELALAEEARLPTPLARKRDRLRPGIAALSGAPTAALKRGPRADSICLLHAVHA